MEETRQFDRAPRSAQWVHLRGPWSTPAAWKAVEEVEGPPLGAPDPRFAAVPPAT
jgi:hypothetical protein